MEIRNGIQYIKPPMIEVPAGEFLMGAIQTQTSPLLLIRAVPSGRGKRDRCDRLERLGTDDRYHAMGSISWQVARATRTKNPLWLQPMRSLIDMIHVMNSS